MRVLVLHAREYGFADKETGRRVEGSKVSYVAADRAQGEGHKGLETFSDVTLPLEAFRDLEAVPGIYDLSYEPRAVKGKVELKLVGLRFISPANVAGLLTNHVTGEIGKPAGGVGR